MAWDWIKRVFGSGRPSAQSGGGVAGAEPPKLRWLEPGDPENPWGVRVLDVRPVTHGTISTSTNVQCAKNSMSFGKDDGTSFVGVAPAEGETCPARLRYRIDGPLHAGVLFTPRKMEHKWAIFLHGQKLLFVRSWTRSVAMTADVEILPDRRELHVTSITGHDDAEHAPRLVDFLIRTHALGVRHPVPLPRRTASDPRSAALFCFSLFGDLAEFAAGEPVDAPVPEEPLRTDTLLHCAVARDNASGVSETGRGDPNRRVRTSRAHADALGGGLSARPNGPAAAGARRVS